MCLLSSVVFLTYSCLFVINLLLNLLLNLIYYFSLNEITAEQSRLNDTRLTLQDVSVQLKFSRFRLKYFFLAIIVNNICL